MKWWTKDYSSLKNCCKYMQDDLFFSDKSLVRKLHSKAHCAFTDYGSIDGKWMSFDLEYTKVIDDVVLEHKHVKQFSTTLVYALCQLYVQAQSKVRFEHIIKDLRPIWQDATVGQMIHLFCAVKQLFWCTERNYSRFLQFWQVVCPPKSKFTLVALTTIQWKSYETGDCLPTAEIITSITSDYHRGQFLLCYMSCGSMNILPLLKCCKHKKHRKSCAIHHLTNQNLFSIHFLHSVQPFLPQLTCNDLLWCARMMQVTNDISLCVRRIQHSPLDLRGEIRDEIIIDAIVNACNVHLPRDLAYIIAKFRPNLSM